MNKNVTRIPVAYSKGVTLIEILLVLGLLVIVLSFAMPSVSGAASKAEMQATVENLQYSLESARKAARLTESVIEMNITSEESEVVRSITFSSPGRQAENGLQIPAYSVPPGIALVSDHSSYRFDERGLVENPGRIVLVSRVDETTTSTINVK